jgi:Na+-transporting methylmalonyl-CoA/oxaloacetate decarboxylase gamma subunit
MIVFVILILIFFVYKIMTEAKHKTAKDEIQI